MDKFTEKANEAMKDINPAEKIVYSSQEEGEESDTSLDKGTIQAVQVAQKLATNPGMTANLPFIGAQKQMNSAYGNLMKGISTRINAVASKLQQTA